MIKFPVDDEQLIEPLGYDFGLTRRTFVQVLGAGLVIVVAAPALGQTTREGRGRRRESRPISLDARLHIDKEGKITVMTGKVEGGQGARAELTQAAAEELGIAVDRITLVMGDTANCPDDGITAGSRTTPGTVPAVRQACAAARKLLRDLSSQNGGKELSYADLASDQSKEALKQLIPSDAQLAPVKNWKVLGIATPRPNGRDLVSGAHRFPSDITRPGMLYGKVLRAPSFGAKLTAVDVAPAEAMDGVVAVHDGDFVGVAAGTSYAARHALEAIEANAKWKPAPHPSSRELAAYLRKHASDAIPENPFTDELAAAAKVLKATYQIPYVQHCPMEPRAAVAQWENGKLTVWTASQNPFGVRRELATAFHLNEDQIRVVIPDFGGGFGGKHTGETAIEAARLAKAAGKPVAVRWNRHDEFTWAYFRPAAVIDIEASLDKQGKVSSWHFINLNSGASGIETPYRIAKNQSQYIKCDAPLRHGSYRALAATANHFARESFMDELASAAGADPLEFRLKHLDNLRISTVLEDAAKRFGWKDRQGQKQPNVGVGLACGTEKGSFVAACAEVEIDRARGAIQVRRITQSFECGAITNPGNLLAQVQGAMIMGLGPALREAIEFNEGKIQNASFWEYPVPRLKDVPELDIRLVNRPDLPSAGAGETPLIAVAPAIGNAVFNACGMRLRELPLKLPPPPQKGNGRA